MQIGYVYDKFIKHMIQFQLYSLIHDSTWNLLVSILVLLHFSMHMFVYTSLSLLCWDLVQSNTSNAIIPWLMSIIYMITFWSIMENFSCFHPLIVHPKVAVVFHNSYAYFLIEAWASVLLFHISAIINVFKDPANWAIQPELYNYVDSDVPASLFLFLKQKNGIQICSLIVFLRLFPSFYSKQLLKCCLYGMKSLNTIPPVILHTIWQAAVGLVYYRRCSLQNMWWWWVPRDHAAILFFDMTVGFVGRTEHCYVSSILQDLWNVPSNIHNLLWDLCQPLIP